MVGTSNKSDPGMAIDINHPAIGVPPWLWKPSDHHSPRAGHPHLSRFDGHAADEDASQGTEPLGWRCGEFSWGHHFGL